MSGTPFQMCGTICPHSKLDVKQFDVIPSTKVIGKYCDKHAGKQMEGRLLVVIPNFNNAREQSYFG